MKPDDKLVKKLEYLELSGPYLEYPHARRLHGYNGLYEIRVEDPSGWYRLFYGFGPRRSGVVPVGVVDGTVKQERNPPIADYERAIQRLERWKDGHRRKPGSKR